MPTLEGKVKLKIPAGTQSGKVFRLKGKGIRRSARLRTRRPAGARSWSRRRGGLTARQRELLEEFARLDGEAVNHPLSKGFVDKLKEMFG